MVSHIQCVLSVCGLVQTDCLTPGTGRETNARRETVAGGLDLAGDEGRDGGGGEEAEDEEDTATALVRIGELCPVVWFQSTLTILQQDLGTARITVLMHPWKPTRRQTRPLTPTPASPTCRQTGAGDRDGAERTTTPR